MKAGWFWKLVELKAVAAKYQHRVHFKRGDNAAYRCAHRHGLIDAICAHMTPNPYRTPSRWTLEEIREEALKYTRRGDFLRAARGMYMSAYKRGFLNTVCEHMEQVNEQV